MTKSINWLHFSDLHFGMDKPGWLWPRVKHDLFRDLEKVAADIGGGWDLVFFTGDLTYSGGKDEFTQVSKEIEELWAVLSKSGTTPKLCLVPGNHDLVRPAPEGAVVKALTQLWSTDPNLRHTFWTDHACEYRKAVESYFKNFAAWASSPPVPMIATTPGALPGDFSATFDKQGLKLGIVGLNSTFLQITNNEFKSKLHLHVSQLNKVCDGDPDRWIKERTAAVLLTHQPPSWLAPDAYNHFRQEIYPPGRFLFQLCGHQHESEAFETAEAGAAPRRLRLGPSLFGLENWGNGQPIKRIHGYSAGQSSFDALEGHEVLMPRTAIAGRHGGLNLAPDHSYTLQEDRVITPFDLEAGAPDDGVSSETTSSGAVASEAATPPAAPPPISAIPLLEAPLDESQARIRLTPAPRLALSFGAQHRFIRQDEQSQFEHELRKAHCIWLVADWGTGKEGFLGSCIERFRVSGQPQDVFHIRCDDAADPDSLEALFPQQVGMPLQTFCFLLASLKTPFLVLDGIHPELCKSPGLQEVIRIAKAVTDYCPNLLLILASRLTPEEPLVPTIELRPLEVPEVRTYLLHHPEAPQALHEAEVLERLHERTDGLPMHLDRIIRSLKVSSLESVLDAEMEGLSTPAPMEETTPKALIHAVTNLANSQDRRSRRSFRLMQVLSVLPYGETLDSLKHFLPPEPFFLDNALQLHDLALLDVITLHQTAPNVSSTVGAEEAAPKLLKVPRQVRDYTQTLLNDKDRWAIVLAGLERFFGRKWRRGKIKLRSLPPEYKDYLNSGPGNEFALIHFVITHGRTIGDDGLLRRGQWLAVQYARHLDSNERYRDLAAVAGGVIQLVERDKHPKDWSILAGLNGSGLRMMGKHEEAIKYFNLALEAGGTMLSDDEKAALWLRIALSEESLGNKDHAVAAAEKVKEYTTEQSPLHAQAHNIILNFTLSSEEKNKQLPAFEQSCRDRGFQTVADNIALSLATETSGAPEKLKHLDRVLKSNEKTYNRVRAIVAKANAVAKIDTAAELNPQDLAALLAAYSYLHAQRFGSLFDSCHRALWQGFETKGETTQLLRLFRHSSFVWRIRGDEKKEATYITRLSAKNVQPKAPPISSLFPIELRYFMKRLKAVITTPTQAVPHTPAPEDSSKAK